MAAKKIKSTNEEQAALLRRPGFSWEVFAPKRLQLCGTGQHLPRYQGESAPLRPPCLKGAVSEADWGIPRQRVTNSHQISANLYCLPQIPPTRLAPGHLPLGKGGFGAAALVEQSYREVS